MTCSQLEHVLEDLKKVHPEFHHFEDLEKALKDCANRETILHIEISPLVRDHRSFAREKIKKTNYRNLHPLLRNSAAWPTRSSPWYTFQT